MKRYFKDANFFDVGTTLYKRRSITSEGIISTTVFNL